MKQEQCVLPQQCRKCGVMFDLWYDLVESGERDGEQIQEKLGKGLAESLCWNCRRRVLDALDGELDEGIEDDAEELILEL